MAIYKAAKFLKYVELESQGQGLELLAMTYDVSMQSLLIVGKKGDTLKTFQVDLSTF